MAPSLHHRPSAGTAAGVAWLVPAGAGAPSVADLATGCGRIRLASPLARGLPQPGSRRGRPAAWPASPRWAWLPAGVCGAADHHPLLARLARTWPAMI